MNKRARLTRRILREHRRGRPYNYHVSGSLFAWWNYWSCPHCPRREVIPMEVPRAYR